MLIVAYPLIGVELHSDHPGFSDKTYRLRREELAAIANSHKTSQPPPIIAYTDVENKTWYFSAFYQ